MTPDQHILALASTTPTFERFQEALLSRACERLRADVGLLAGKQAPARRAEIGFDRASAERLYAGWDVYGPEVHPVQIEAARAGVASDVRTLGSALEETRVYREVMAPLGGTESLFLLPSFRGRTVCMLMLGRCRRRFTTDELSQARALSVAIGVAWAAASAPAGAGSAPVTEAARAPGTPVQPGLTALLTPAEADLLRYLELGHTTRDIAAARETSFFTVRNQLSALYRKLGVCNRTEAVGLLHRPDLAR